MLRRIVIGLISFLFVGGALIGHEGHEHQSPLLGKVERVRQCHLVVTTTESETKTIFLSSTTRYERGAQAATKEDLEAGARVSVELEDDGETAKTVKLGGAR